MTVYSYTGKLTDFGESPFPEAIPKLWVEPERDAFARSGPLAAKRIPVRVLDSGNFSVDLLASIDTTPPTNYSLRCEWLQGIDGPPLGWAQWDFTAQIGGGAIATMPNFLSVIWYSSSPPPAERDDIYWVHPGTGDVKVWR